MTNLAKLPPMGLKAEKPPKPAPKRMRAKSAKRAAYERSEEGQDGLSYMGKVRLLPCVICDGWGMVQNSPTEAHHCKSGRYGNLREHDRLTIPLCHSHHNKLRPYKGDEDKLGYHNGQETWETEYGPDYDFVAATLDAVEAMI